MLNPINLVHRKHKSSNSHRAARRQPFRILPASPDRKQRKLMRALEKTCKQIDKDNALIDSKLAS